MPGSLCASASLRHRAACAKPSARGAVISLVNFDVSSYQGAGLSRVDLLDSVRMVRSQRA